ncbi:phage holin [Virgibacillus dokdonensis]|uniref:Phage holin n=1 Tax=Virgibacillus dokdonensis TaxID=302167 RepID=A0ABU7VGN1_9BACI
MKTAIVRLVALSILLLNQALITFGYQPLPLNEDEIYEIVSTIATTIMAIYAWWKNNNITKKAQENEKFLKENGMK